MRAIQRSEGVSALHAAFKFNGDRKTPASRIEVEAWKTHKALKKILGNIGG